MATTYVGDGERFTVTADDDYTAGDIYVLLAGTTGMAGVVVDTVASGATAVVATEGVWTVTKIAAANLDFVIGERAFTTATGRVTPTATGNTAIGYAYAIAATGDTTAQIKLVPGDLGPS